MIEGTLQNANDVTTAKSGAEILVDGWTGTVLLDPSDSAATWEVRLEARRQFGGGWVTADTYRHSDTDRAYALDIARGYQYRFKLISLSAGTLSVSLSG